MYQYIFVVLVLFIIIKSFIRKQFGYLEGHLNNNTKDSAKLFNYKIVEKFDSNYKKYYFESQAFNKNQKIGNLKLIPWTFNEKSIYIGKDLYVLNKFQKKGIANEIVKKGVNFILEKNSFGVFCTNTELSLADCLFKLYWIKTPITALEQETSINNLELVSYNDVSLKNYPFHNSFFNVPKTQIYNFLNYLDNLGIVFLQNENKVFAIERYKDSQNDYVAYVKFLWVDDLENISIYRLNICKLLNVKYIAFPKVIQNRNIPPNIWDVAYYYIYAKPKHFKYNIFSSKDILAWYL